MIPPIGRYPYGAGLPLLSSPVSGLRQIHRNFSETFYVFQARMVAPSMIGAFGAWSLKGAIAYAAGGAVPHPIDRTGATPAKMGLGRLDCRDSRLRRRADPSGD